MRKLWISIAIAALAMVPAIYFRATGLRPDAILDALIFGTAILAAGFMLSWGAETAEGQISAGLILAVVAIITVLPEYAVDIYYAWRAGQAPESNYVHYAAANMTGANRLLVGLAWPMLVLLHWWKTRQRQIPLAPVNGIEIVFLLLPSLYAFTILLRDSISFVDAIVLIAIFAAYLWRVASLAKVHEEEDEEEGEVGLAIEIEKLPVTQQWLLMTGLAVVAALSFSSRPSLSPKRWWIRGACSGSTSSCSFSGSHRWPAKRPPSLSRSCSSCPTAPRLDSPP